MNKLILVLLVIGLLFSSCNKKGDYQYIIIMKNGDRIKAWSANTEGSMVSVMPQWGNNEHYYHLSPVDVEKIIYVGSMNDNK